MTSILQMRMRRLQERMWSAPAPPTRLSRSPVRVAAAAAGQEGDLELTLWAEKETPACHEELLLVYTNKWIHTGCCAFKLD